MSFTAQQIAPASRSSTRSFGSGQHGYEEQPGLRWSVYPEQQLRLELIHPVSRVAVTVTSHLSGWICNEDQIIVRGHGFAELLADMGVIASEVTEIHGAAGLVLASLKARTMKNIPVELLEIAR